MTQPPIEFDLDQIEAAIRRIADLAWREHYATGAGPSDPPPGTPETEIGKLIARPVFGAYQLAHKALHAYLASTVGREKANEITLRIEAETIRALYPDPPSDAARH